MSHRHGPPQLDKDTEWSHDPKVLFVASYNSLQACRILEDPNPKLYWKSTTSLFESLDDTNSSSNNKKHPLRTLKMMCRTGIPPILRCAIWITSVMRITQTPHQPERIIQQYGTLSKVQVLEHGWNLVLEQMFPDPSDECDAIPYLFGLNPVYMELLNDYDNLNSNPSMTRILCAIQHHLDVVQYAPLIPTLTHLFLSHMTEAHAYTTIREMILHSSSRACGYHFPTTQCQHYTWCKTFADIMRRMHPQTAQDMQVNQALTPEGLDPIFKRFFLPILRREHVLRILDIYVTEGYKVLFRVGITLIAAYKKPLKSMKINNAALWWAELRDFTHASTFDFDVVLKKAYGFHGSGMRKRILFPRRRTIERFMKVNETWVEHHYENELSIRPTIPPKPISFIEYKHKYNSKEDGEEEEAQDVEPLSLELARPATIRANLAQWLPRSLLSYKLDLLYSTNVHGRSLSMLYDKVQRTKRTIMLIEVLSKQNQTPTLPTSSTSSSSQSLQQNSKQIIGMYASQAWHRSKDTYGDGECFLFSIMDVNAPKCYKWRPLSAGSFDESKNNDLSLQEQFMISTDKFLAMGGNAHGSSGLRLNQDLTRGESSRALGFDNDPLAGNEEVYFDVGLVEVYRFVRGVDGRGIDGEDDEIWSL